MVKETDLDPKLCLLQLIWSHMVTYFVDTQRQYNLSLLILTVNFFATEHVCNVRVSSTIQEYEEKFAHSTVDIVTFSNQIIAKLTCNYLIIGK